MTTITQKELNALTKTRMKVQIDLDWSNRLVISTEDAKSLIDIFSRAEILNTQPETHEIKPITAHTILLSACPETEYIEAKMNHLLKLKGENDADTNT